jgi:hypothetical protein
MWALGYDLLEKSIYEVEAETVDAFNSLLNN